MPARIAIALAALVAGAAAQGFSTATQSTVYSAPPAQTTYDATAAQPGFAVGSIPQQPVAQPANLGQPQSPVQQPAYTTGVAPGGTDFFTKHKSQITALLVLAVAVCICCVIPCFCMKEAYECLLGPGSYGDPSGNGYGGMEMGGAMAAAGAAGYMMGQGGMPGFGGQPQGMQMQQMYPQY